MAGRRCIKNAWRSPFGCKKPEAALGILPCLNPNAELTISVNVQLDHNFPIEIHILLFMLMEIL